MTIVTIQAGDASVDYAAAINAALADPAVTEVRLGAGTFTLHSPIFVPSGKSLTGAGKDQSMLLCADDFDRPGLGEADGVVNTAYGATGVTLSDFSIDGAKLMPDGFRMVGCFMRQAHDFQVTNVDVYNTTGYAHFVQGNVNAAKSYATNGTYDGCTVYNAQIAFEQMFADGITLTDCHARDGDGDLVGTYFHPLTGSKNITYIDCTAYGRANVGFELTSDGAALDNIHIINCVVEMTGGGSAFVAAGSYAFRNLQIEGSEFIAHNNIAALFYGAIGTATDTYFQGDPMALIFFTGPDGTRSQFTITDSHALALRDPQSGGAAYGISGTGTILWDGGSIEARAPVGLMHASGSTNVTVTPDTKLITKGYGATLRYTEDGPALAIAPNVVLTGPGAAGFQGATLTVSFQAKGTATDILAIADQGSGAGKIDVAGNDIVYGGKVIGTFSGGTGGADLVIVLTADATPEAVQALARAITYAHTAVEPALHSRAVEFVLADAAGNVAKANAVVIMIPFDDQALLTIDEADRSYTENAAATTIAPDALITDVDSTKLAGGKLTVSITSGLTAGDTITIKSVGTGPGQIGLSGRSVTYGGVEIGTLTSGVVTFNAQASAAAAQALVRSFQFYSKSDNPGDGERQFTFTISDALGRTTSATATVTVEPVDDGPRADDATAATSENQAVTIAVSTDPDGGSNSPITMVAGQAIAPGETVTIASGAKVTLNQDGTFTYAPGAIFDHLAAGATGTDTFTWGIEAGTATVTVTLTGTDDQGLLTHDGPIQTYVENSPALVTAPTALYTDIDVASGKLTVQITSGATAGDLMTIRSVGTGPGEIALSGSSITYGGVQIGTLSSGVVTFNANATAAAVQALVRSYAFVNNSDTPAEGARTVTYTLVDATGRTTAATATVSVEAVDDAPRPQNATAATGENQAVNVAVSSTDVDGGPTSPVATVAGQAIAPGGTVTIASGARVTLNQNGTFTYDPAAGLDHLAEGATGTDAFTYGLAAGGTATVTVTLTGTDDQGLLTHDGPARPYVENSPSLVAAPTALYVDPDVATGKLTVQITSGGSAGDSLTIRSVGTGPGDIALAGPSITYGGVQIGTLSSGVVTFNANATAAAVQALIRSYAFVNNSDTPTEGTRTITYKIVDAAGRITTATAAVTVEAVDDGPRPQNATAATGENQAVNIALTSTDVDGGPASPVATVAFQAIAPGGTVSIASGARVTLNQNGTFTYDPAAGFDHLAEGATGTDAFTYGLAAGGTATVTVTLTGTDDPGLLTYQGPASTYVENGPTLITAPTALYADPDVANLTGAKLRVQVTSGGTIDDLMVIKSVGTGPGEIALSGRSVTYGGVEIGTLVSGIITFNAGATAAGVQALIRSFGYYNPSENPVAGTRQITYSVTDAKGRVTSTTTQVTIQAVDDAPIARNTTAGTSENAVATFAVSVLDFDGGPGPAVATVGGKAIATGQTVTLASGAKVTLNADGRLSYDPAGAFNSLTDGSSGSTNTSATDQFAYTLASGGSAFITVTVTGVGGSGDVQAGGPGDDTITGTSGADFFRLEQGGVDNASGGAGNDAFYFGAALTAADRVDGGPGRDQLGLQGNYNLTLGAGNLVGIETLALLSGAETSFGASGQSRFDYVLKTVEANVAKGETLTVNFNGLLAGEDVTFDGSAETDGAFFFYGGKGVDTLTGGAGADSFFFGSGAQFAATDRIVGGSGADQVGLRGNYTVTFADATMTGVEALGLVSGKDGHFGPAGPAFQYDITIANGNVASGQRLSVNANGLAADESLRFNGSAETDGSFRFIAGKGSDTLVGGTGNDSFYGNLGQDRLEGGGGADTFVYRAAAESTSTGFDTLVGFDWSEDLLDLPGATHAYKGSTDGHLDQGSFDADLGAAMAGLLTGAGDAGILTASSGTMSGRSFLVVDANGVAGYQAGQDYVFELVGTTSLPVPPGEFMI